MKTSILIRHAITPGNVLKKYTGRRSDEGIIMPDPEAARMIRDKISEYIDRYIKGDFSVVSGPQIRSRETAALLFPGRDISTVDELCEMDLGMFEGKTYEELKDVPEYVSWLESGGLMNIPGGEERDTFIRRSMEGFKKAIALSNDDGVVIVCHGGNIMAVMSTLTDLDYYDCRVPNLGGYVLNIDADDEGLSVYSYDRIVCGPFG